MRVSLALIMIAAALLFLGIKLAPRCTVESDGLRLGGLLMAGCDNKP